MGEIYERHSAEYDELVAFEDHGGSLGKVLEEAVRPGARVLELGAGTGRVTRLYAGRAGSVTCCDRSAHMLARARESLHHHKDRITFAFADNDDLPDLGGPYDLVVEGWSFGHSAVAHEADLEGWFEGLHARLLGFLAPGGRIMVIETLGTLVAEPTPPGPVLGRFYGLLEGQYGYRRLTIDTSYRFPDRAAAERILGFFFGPAMASRVLSPIVPEFTGVWLFAGDGSTRPARR
jgi:SAM-dependent methyltransferase